MPPPVGWAEVATKHDLAELERRLDLRFETFEARFDARLDRELRELENRFLNRLVVVNGIFFTLVAAAQQLLR